MSTITSTTTTVLPVDSGMIIGVTLASLALIVVVGAIGWQCYVGNVKARVTPGTHRSRSGGSLLPTDPVVDMRVDVTRC